MTFAEIIKALIALPEIIKAFKSLIGKLEEVFGPDWSKKINDLQAANNQLEKANTNEEKDEALKAISGAFYRKP